MKTVNFQSKTAMFMVNLRFHCFSWIFLLMAAVWGAAWAAEMPPVVQPDKITGKWKIIPLRFPPLQQVIDRGLDRPVPIYGLYSNCSAYKKHRASIKKAGWKTFKIGGPIDDESMKAFVEDGIEIIKPASGWLLSKPGPRVHGGSGPRANYPSDEAFMDAYLKALETFMNRYGPGGLFFKENPGLPQRPIDFIEIWTEPNAGYMIGGSANDPKINAEREALYAKLLIASYDLLKKKWTGVKVGAFSTASTKGGEVRFIRNVHKQDPRVAKNYDVLTMHPYSHGVPMETEVVLPWGSYSTVTGLAKVRDFLAESGINKPIWYSELGWAVYPEEGGSFKGNNRDKQTTALLASAYLCRAYALGMRLDIERMDYMYVEDADTYNGGFFNRDGSWRPATYAVQNMIQLMPNPKLTGAVSDGKDGYYVYQFLADKKNTASGCVTMVWNVAGPKTVEIPCKAASPVVYDMYGHGKSLQVSQGKATVEIGPCPVYLVEK